MAELIIKLNTTDAVNKALADLKKELPHSLNTFIRESSAEGYLNTNELSDGYHTFGDLYEHRCVLWVKLCEMLFDIDNNRGDLNRTWKSLKNSDGTAYEGYFILGYGHNPGEQITYHLPVLYWDMAYFAEELELHGFDGHTPTDVLKRLKEL